MASQLYALVLAGGSGERFWPLSRKSRPKQLLRLLSETTLLEETLQRLEGLVPPEHTLLLTNRDQEETVRALLPDFPQENILAEPAKRDTAAAIALGAAWVCVRDPFATMVVLPADHRINDREAFQGDIRSAAAAAGATGDLVTLGIQPQWACPSFGYIELGKEVKPDNGAASRTFHEVARFREKPAPDLAEHFIRQGNFLWNAGIFVWKVNSIITEFNRHAPALAGFVAQVHESKNVKKTVEARFASLPKISIDYAIMEKASRVLVTKTTFDWDDVGTWAAVSKYLNADKAGNRSNTTLSISGASNNIIFSEQKRHIALLGVQDLIVVETADAILVASRHEAEAIKKLVPKLPEELQ
jgi:mannose-1-phosphate guanylyltransferase